MTVHTGDTSVITSPQERHSQLPGGLAALRQCEICHLISPYRQRFVRTIVKISNHRWPAQRVNHRCAAEASDSCYMIGS